MFEQGAEEIIGTKMDEVPGGWRKLHKHVAQMGGEEELIFVIGRQARGQETTRKTKMQVDG
jgi:hypothetical protein